MKEKIVTQRILTAEEGMFLTDGEIYCQTVVLPFAADPGLWREVSQNPEEAL